MPFMSLSARRAWIEILLGHQTCTGEWSLSARRAWIEILLMVVSLTVLLKSLSARRAWIEIINRTIC